MDHIRITLLMFVIILSIISVQCSGSISWNLVTHPVILGQSVDLMCEVKNYTADGTKSWMRGANFSLLAVNETPVFPEKYRMKVKDAESFFLTIYNVSIDDLKYKYTCICKFKQYTSTINVTASDIMALPSKSLVRDDIRVADDIIDVHFTLFRVSQEPTCSAYFQGRRMEIKIAEQNFTENNVLKDIEYRSFIEITETGSHRVTIECFLDQHGVVVIDRVLNVVKAKGSITWPYIIGGCSAVLLLVILVIKIKYVRSYWVKCFEAGLENGLQVNGGQSSHTLMEHSEANMQTPTTPLNRKQTTQ